MKRKKLRIKNKYRFFIFMTIVCIILISSINTILGLNTAASAQDPIYKEVSVQEGDTVWTLAQNNISNQTDTRKFIYEIKLVNHLDNGYIYPGQVIKIPISTEEL